MPPLPHSTATEHRPHGIIPCDQSDLSMNENETVFSYCCRADYCSTSYSPIRGQRANTALSSSALRCRNRCIE